MSMGAPRSAIRRVWSGLTALATTVLSSSRVARISPDGGRHFDEQFGSLPTSGSASSSPLQMTDLNWQVQFSATISCEILLGVDELKIIIRSHFNGQKTHFVTPDLQ
jgi:hypothetical protein